jgi:hypothetical protein
MFSENNIPRTYTRGSVVAVFSEELSSWGGPFWVSQRQEILSRESTNPSGHAIVLPSIRPAIQTPAQILVATQVPTLLPQPQSASGISVHQSPPSYFSQPALSGGLSSER